MKLFKSKREKAIIAIRNDIAKNGVDSGEATYQFFNSTVSWSEFMNAMEEGRKLYEKQNPPNGV